MEPQKRKRDVISIEKKLEIIAEIRNGSTAVALSVRFGVPRTTINGIKKNAENIAKFASQMESLYGLHKTRKTMKSTMVDEIYGSSKNAARVSLCLVPLLQKKRCFSMAN